MALKSAFAKVKTVIFEQASRCKTKTLNIVKDFILFLKISPFNLEMSCFHSFIYFRPEINASLRYNYRMACQQNIRSENRFRFVCALSPNDLKTVL